MLRLLIEPFIVIWSIAAGIWNRSADWNWPIGVRIAAALSALGAAALFFVWTMNGFQWPFG